MVQAVGLEEAEEPREGAEADFHLFLRNRSESDAGGGDV